MQLISLTKLQSSISMREHASRVRGILMIYHVSLVLHNSTSISNRQSLEYVWIAQMKLFVSAETSQHHGQATGDRMQLETTSTAASGRNHVSKGTKQNHLEYVKKATMEFFVRIATQAGADQEKLLVQTVPTLSSISFSSSFSFWDSSVPLYSLCDPHSVAWT